MTPKQIRIVMLEKDITQADIAREEKTSIQAVNHSYIREALEENSMLKK